VPWQQLISETGAVLRVHPGGRHRSDPAGRVPSDTAVGQDETCLPSDAGVQRVGDGDAGREDRRAGHRAGARVLIDGAQSVPHLRVNMQAMGADFFVFSGHKIFAPTGIGCAVRRPECWGVGCRVGGGGT